MRSMVILDVQWRAYRLPFVGARFIVGPLSEAATQSGDTCPPDRVLCVNSFAPFATAHGVMAVREGAIVEIITEQGISGIGEIAPLPEFGRGNLTDALTALPTLAARLHGKTLAEALDFLHTAVVDRYLSPMSPMSPCSKNLPVKKALAGTLSGGQVSRSALICGLEIALLDALGKVEGCGISTLLSSAGPTINQGTLPGGQVSTPHPADAKELKGYPQGAPLRQAPLRVPTGPRPGVQVNAVVGARATEAAVTAAKEAVAAGFGCVKLKVGWGNGIQEEVARVAAVREAIGPDIRLRLDANEAWSLEQAIAILSNCAQFDIQYVEQPIKASDLAEMRTLRQAAPMPIAADEALYDLKSARRILDSRAADILIVKPQLAGGLRVGQQIIQEAAQRGTRSVVTSTIETGIGLVAALHLAAASPAITLECGLATRHLLVDDLLIDDLPIRNGFLAVPTGPGLGVVLDREALDTYSLRELT